MREKLIELISRYDFDSTQCNLCNRADEECLKCGSECLADYLLQNGVVVLPCKVGDTVFVIPTKENCLLEIAEMRCIGFSLGEPNNTANLANDKNKLYQPSFDEFGKTVFISKEEAEKALERRKNDENPQAY